MMNFEKPFESKQNIESQIEKAEKIVKEIINQLKNNPQYKEIANQKSEKIKEKWEQLKASAKNARSSNQIQEFIKNRFNNSLNKIGMNSVFDIDIKLLEPTLWFEVEIKSTKEGDFFYKKQVDYNKKSQSITEDDLF